MNLSKEMENKIKKFTKSININIQYGKHIEFFEIDDNNLNDIIKKIDNLSFNINKDIDNDINDDNLDKTIKIEEHKTKQLEINKKIEEDKTKQLEIEYKILQLKLELINISNNNKIIL